MSSELEAALALGEGVAGTAPATAALGIRDLQRLLGGYQWVERRVFEVLGSWVGNETVPEARMLFDIQSQYHAWHAELFAERMPAFEGVDPAVYVVPPSAEADQLLTTLGGGAMSTPQEDTHAAAGGTLLRLVGWARVVLPRLVTGYGLHLRRCAPVADAPIVRALRLVVRDDIEAWQAAEVMVEALVRRPHDVAVVTAHQEALEAKVAGAGPGLVPWPGSSSV